MQHTIQMVDLQSQYKRLKSEIDAAMQDVIINSAYINGPTVRKFEGNLASYLGVKHVIGCGNGTDALQIALMALNLPKGAEIIIPAFSYVAVAEVIVLLGFVPVFVDVEEDSFILDASKIEEVITENTAVIMPVHLFGQGCDMNEIKALAEKYNLKIVEDNAQSLGADGQFLGNTKKLGTIGDIGCTSFFPSKILGCFGDGGAIFTNSDELAESVRMIANHGQKQKYFHELVGVNSRLDSLQAAVLDVKLNYLDEFISSRNKVADAYNNMLDNCEFLSIPTRKSNHVFHQYTLIVKDAKRDVLRKFLKVKGIPTMVYYPLPLHKQEAYSKYTNTTFPNSEKLSNEVLSLPIHTEMNDAMLTYIGETILSFQS